MEPSKRCPIRHIDVMMKELDQRIRSRLDEIQPCTRQELLTVQGCILVATCAYEVGYNVAKYQAGANVWFVDVVLAVCQECGLRHHTDVGLNVVYLVVHIGKDFFVLFGVSKIVEGMDRFPTKESVVVDIRCNVILSCMLNLANGDELEVRGDVVVTILVKQDGVSTTVRDRGTMYVWTPLRTKQVNSIEVQGTYSKVPVAVR